MTLSVFIHYDPIGAVFIHFQLCQSNISAKWNSVFRDKQFQFLRTIRDDDDDDDDYDDVDSDDAFAFAFAAIWFFPVFILRGNGAFNRANDSLNPSRTTNRIHVQIGFSLENSSQTGIRRYGNPWKDYADTIKTRFPNERKP